MLVFLLQLITSVPTKRLPKHLCSWGKGEPDDIDHIDAVEPGQPQVDGMGRRGQILWVRGLTRLQQQVSENYFPVCIRIITVASPGGSLSTRHLSYLLNMHMVVKTTLL